MGKPDEKYLPFQANLVGQVDFTVNAESSDTITVNCQFKDHNGNDLGEPVAGRLYLSDDSLGLDVVSTAASGGITAGTDGSIQPIEHGSSAVGKHAGFITEADGDLDVNVIHSGAKTCYLVIVLPSGRLEVSSVLTFGA